MKHLLVMRHAKSSWDDPGFADIDRPLNERGKRTAPFMGALMRRRDLLPDCIISSPADRALTTARLAKEGGAFDAPLETDDRIYEASPNTLRQIVANTDNACASVLLVGHNPGLEGVIRYLTGETHAMPTGAVAVIDLDVENWQQVDAGVGTLIKIYKPREEMNERTGKAS